MKAVCLALAALLSAPTQEGRAQNWRASSPAGGGFSVELPAPLRRVTWFEGEHGASLEPDQRIAWAACFAAVETTPKESRFGVVRIGRKARKMFLRSRPRDESLRYLSVIFIGDDDDATPDLEREVRANGLSGREYFYVRDDAGGTVGIHTRGRIFDAGGKIYVVVFVGRKTDDLTSHDAERFLNSFRLKSRDGKVKVRARNR